MSEFKLLINGDLVEGLIYLSQLGFGVRNGAVHDQLQILLDRGAKPALPPPVSSPIFFILPQSFLGAQRMSHEHHLAVGGGSKRRIIASESQVVNFTIAPIRLGCARKSWGGFARAPVGSNWA